MARGRDALSAPDPTDRAPVGRTGVAVSRLGIGGGSSFIRAGDDRRLVVDAAYAAGLRHFDTAPLYGLGTSESTYGEALAAYPRETLTISTKVGREGQAAFDYSGANVTRSIARSRERLRVAAIDIALIHDVDPDFHDDFEARFREAVDEAWPALDRLRSEGSLRAIGVGLKNVDAALRLLQARPFDCVMLAGAYTLLEHRALDDLLPWCVEHSVAVLLAAPLNTGILATGAIPGARYFYRDAPPKVMERTARMEAVCARHEVPLPAAALQFPLRHPAVASVVVGHERPEEVTRNVALMRHPIPDAMWDELKSEGLIPAHAPV
ncbi:MAG: aldo/keto reductase [Burkholderiales bacterium]